MKNNFFNTIMHRRKHYKDALISQNKAIKDQLKLKADSLQTIDFLPANKERVMGVSNNFSSYNPFSIIHFGFYDDNLDVPTRIRAIQIKSRTQKLNYDDIKQLQRYYYMTDNQQDKDNRAVLTEGYRLGKKIFGLNARNTAS